MALTVYEMENQGVWDDMTWSHSSMQKSKRPHPGTQILSQIPKGGEGNREGGGTE